MNPRDDSNTSTRSLFPCLMLALTLLPGPNDLMSGSHMALPLLQSDHHPKLSPQRILWGVGNPIKRSKPRHSTLVSVYFFSLILLLLQFIICSFVVSLVIFCLYPEPTHTRGIVPGTEWVPGTYLLFLALVEPHPILQLHTLFICFQLSAYAHFGIQKNPFEIFPQNQKQRTKGHKMWEVFLWIMKMKLQEEKWVVQGHIAVKNWDVLRFYPTGKLASSLLYCHGRWQRHGTPGSETKDFIFMA